MLPRRSRLASSFDRSPYLACAHAMAAVARHDSMSLFAIDNLAVWLWYRNWSDNALHSTAKGDVPACDCSNSPGDAWSPGRKRPVGGKYRKLSGSRLLSVVTNVERHIEGYSRFGLESWPLSRAGDACEHTLKFGENEMRN
jgi:hypothetical protein